MPFAAYNTNLYSMIIIKRLIKFHSGDAKYFVKYLTPYLLLKDLKCADIFKAGPSFIPIECTKCSSLISISAWPSISSSKNLSAYWWQPGISLKMADKDTY